MAPITPRRGGRVALWLSILLFLVFVLLACYHKYIGNQVHVETDVSLQQELADATILEEDAPLASAGWPQWRGVRRDGVAYGTDLRLDWQNEEPPQLWKVEGGEGFSSFAVRGGRAYTMFRKDNEEIVVCLDTDDGKERWRFPYPCDFGNSFGRGPRSTPTLDGDRLYAVGANGLFHCLDAAAGKKLWGHDLLREFNAPNLQWGVAFSPLVEGNLVITNPGGRDNNSVAAFNKFDGTLVWASQSEPAGYSSPVAVGDGAARQILVFSGTALLSVSPRDGSLNWRYPWEVQSDVNAATPIVFRAKSRDRILDYVFISSGYNKGCALLRLGVDANGKSTVQRVYAGNQMCNHFATSVRYRDHLYGFNETKLTCLELKTGKVKWAESGYHKGSLLRVDDRLIVLGERGKLAVVAASPEGYQELGDVRPLRNKCWTMPVLCDGRLLLRDEEVIECLDLRRP